MGKALERPHGGQTLWIRTPDQRLRVFISSTLQELATEREAATAAVHSLRQHAVLFELGARPHPPRELYRAYLDQSHIFVGIYCESYGWVAPDMEISGIEDEYLLSGDKPKLVYIREPAPNRDPRLMSLLDRIRADEAVSYKRFSDPDELGRLIADDLALLLTERFEATDVKRGPDDHFESHVPALVNEFVGRSDERARVGQLFIDGARLVTLTGPGGIGKSRLALELATELKDGFADGAHFVSLEAIRDPDLVAPTIMHTLGITEAQASPLEWLITKLRARNLLLVLDNFEQVLPAALHVSRLVEECPDVRVLVTSMATLRLRGETEVPISPLSLPAAHGKTQDDLIRSDAMRLFITRAKEFQRDFEPTESDMRAVAEICRQLDGLPLALELAAARIRLLTPQAMLGRLDDRFALLTGGAKDFPDRHQALRATIDWSFELLGDDDKRFFGRCSVFEGGWTLEAAEAICDLDGTLDVVERMQSLLEQSLIRHSSLGGKPRFSMFESVRRYASERLEASGESELMSKRHAGYFLEMIDRSYRGLRSPHQVEWLDRLEADLENCRGMFKWCLRNHRAERVVDAAWGLWVFWWSRVHLAEGRLWMDEVLESGDELSEQRRARAMAIKGGMALWQGDIGEAVPPVVEAEGRLGAVGDDQGVALCQVVLAFAEAGIGNSSGAIERLRDARQHFRNVGDEFGQMISSWLRRLDR